MSIVANNNQSNQSQEQVSVTAGCCIKPYVSEELTDSGNTVLRTANNSVYQYVGSFPFTTSNLSQETTEGKWVVVVQGTSVDFTQSLSSRILDTYTKPETYTQTEVDDAILLAVNNAVQTLLDNPDADVNSIAEVNNLLQNNVTQIATKVSYTESQSLTSAQKTIAKTNIGLENVAYTNVSNPWTAAQTFSALATFNGGINSTQSVANAVNTFGSSHPSGLANLQLKAAGNASIRYIGLDDSILSRIDLDANIITFLPDNVSRLTIDTNSVDSSIVINANSGINLAGNLYISNGGVIKGSGTDWTYYEVGQSHFDHRFYTRTNVGTALERLRIEGGFVDGVVKILNADLEASSNKITSKTLEVTNIAEFRAGVSLYNIADTTQRLTFNPNNQSNYLLYNYDETSTDFHSITIGGNSNTTVGVEFRGNGVMNAQQGAIFGGDINASGQNVILKNAVFDGLNNDWEIQTVDGQTYLNFMDTTAGSSIFRLDKTIVRSYRDFYVGGNITIQNDELDILNLYRPNSSTAAQVGIDFDLNGNLGNRRRYARIGVNILDNTDATVDGQLVFNVTSSGSGLDALLLDKNEAHFNVPINASGHDIRARALNLSSDLAKINATTENGVSGFGINVIGATGGDLFRLWDDDNLVIEVKQAGAINFYKDLNASGQTLTVDEIKTTGNTDLILAPAGSGAVKLLAADFDANGRQIWGATTITASLFNGNLSNGSGITGTGTGDANTAFFEFNESDGTTRQGFVGAGSSANQWIQIYSDAASKGLSLIEDGTLFWGTNEVLDANNYTSYSDFSGQTVTASNFVGNWNGVSNLGNAQILNQASNNGLSQVASNFDLNTLNTTIIYGGADMVNGPDSSSGVVVSLLHSGNNFGGQFKINASNSSPKMRLRGKSNGTFSSWVEILHSGNISSYIPSNVLTATNYGATLNSVYDNYQYFNLKTNGVQRRQITSLDSIDFRPDDNIVNISYAAGGVVNFSIDAGEINYADLADTPELSIYATKTYVDSNFVLSGNDHPISDFENDEGYLISSDLSGYARHNVVQSYTKAQYFLGTEIAYASTVTWNLDNDQITDIALTGNITINVSNVRKGATYELALIQNNGGGHTVTWDSDIEFGDDGAPTLSTTASKTDILIFKGGNSGKLFFIGIKKGYDNYLTNSANP